MLQSQQIDRALGSGRAGHPYLPPGTRITAGCNEYLPKQEWVPFSPSSTCDIRYTSQPVEFSSHSKPEAVTFQTPNLQPMAPSCGKRSITPGISILDAQLMVCGQPILSNLPTNVRLTPDPGLGVLHGAFLGVSASEPSSRHVLPIGNLEGRRFMCCFRFKLWWMTQRMGNAGRHVPQETQFMLLESKTECSLSEGEELEQDDQTVYTVFLPLLDGPFRASLQGTDLDELQLCLESGDPVVMTSQSSHAMYIGSGADPFEVVSDAVRAVEAHSCSFAHREKKKMPGLLDCFGWCTWDAFYTDVTADAVNEGLKSLFEGGTPARFLIIDDGWQSLDSDDKGGNATVSVGTQYASRLSSIKANHKFERDDKENGASVGLQHLVQASKANFQLKYIYVWHALAGYWGGVQPNAEMDQYKPVVTYPVHSPGILANQPDMATDSLTVNGLGLVNTEKLYEFFNDLHSYLASAGVDGVKVDAQSIIETLGGGCGGRVQLVKQYIQALEASVAQNFPDNGCIACMSHSSDGIYSTKQIAVVRASDDFYPRDPASHTIHIASVTYNSLFLGEFMQPDWDMFQSLHPAASYHAAARAVGGCAIYVSDRPGQHDFELLRKLVLPDGTVLRAKLPGRPTCDSLFVDPARDGTSLLKIWNLNKFTGVLGVFNCQGAGWCKDGKINRIHDTAPASVTGGIRGLDVHLLADVAGTKWNGECVVFSHQAGEVWRLPKAESRPVTLKVLEYEVFTVTPVEEVAAGVWFAPIGLLDMLNSGAAVDALSHDATEPVVPGGQGDGTCRVTMKLRGCGKFGAYSSRRPKAVLPLAVGAGMCYREADGLVTFSLPVPEEGQLWDVTIHL